MRYSSSHAEDRDMLDNDLTLLTQREVEWQHHGRLIMTAQGSSYTWDAQTMSNGVQGTQPLTIDTGLNNDRSMPHTPATTPPSASIHGMQNYQNQQNYDKSRPLYSAAPQQHGQNAPQQNVGQHNLVRFGQPMRQN
jgi:protein SOK2